MTNFDKTFDADPLSLKKDDNAGEARDKSSTKPAQENKAEVTTREVDLTLYGTLTELCSYADQAISEGFVREVHVTSEVGKTTMKMEYDEAVSTFLTTLVSDKTEPDRKLEFSLSAK